MRGWHGRMAVVGAALAVMVSVAPAAARVDPPGYGSHEGDRGLHWILDNPGPDPELPAATCIYGGSNLRLKMIRVRQPVILANKEGGFARQQVGWRAVIERSADGNAPWTKVVSSGWTKKIAVAPYPVDLAPKEVAIPSPPAVGLYRVTWQMRWYRSNGSVDGWADHSARWYRATSELGPFTTDTGCPHTLQAMTSVATRVTDPAAEPAFNGELEHTGKRGDHWILDNPGPYPEFPAVTCAYAPSGSLQSLTVRRPMILARDTGAGVQAQDVAWRIVLQGTTQTTAPYTWSQVGTPSPWVRARATETSWAKLKPVTIPGAPLSSRYAGRVIYELRWYKGSTNQVVGTARHTPLWYGATQGAIDFGFDFGCTWIAD